MLRGRREDERSPEEPVSGEPSDTICVSQAQAGLQRNCWKEAVSFLAFVKVRGK